MDKKAKCRSCGAEIVWMRTLRGKIIPVDANTNLLSLLPLPEIFNPKIMTAHFSTCPDAKKWRKK